MGGLSTITGTLGSVASTLGTVQQTVGLVQTLAGNSPSSNGDELALRQLQERQNLNQAQLAQQNALERERLATQSAQDEQDRQDALRRAVARQRASFGGRGVSSSGGSSQAVLLGLVDESEDELRQRESLDNLRSRALDLEETQAESLNLLQSTQLRQRQKLNDLF